MGSIEYAPLARCRCRICHQWQTSMIHVYMGCGQRLRLVEKMKAYGLKITPTDLYPKTICKKCIDVLETNYFFQNTLKLISTRGKLGYYGFVTLYVTARRRRGRDN
ncbi:uncharacterized protein LOC111599362 [Drosophila hydei]|uniref:Uncharacterized protein LOC111599362 n=1 Tax=Drosophila hydei TaxID=7224 RepID=A0A6J1LYE5_DROHY|nr:uncharacterized protein LOC111599362 [Drosophila hydei]